MNKIVKLNFQTRQMESAGRAIGQFKPLSPTEGELELKGSSYTYKFYGPFSYGYNIGLYRLGKEIAVRNYDVHEGEFRLRVTDHIIFDLNNESLYCSKGPAGKVTFTEHEVVIQFNDLVPEKEFGVIAALVSLDTMWANLVGFTRTRAQQRVQPGRA